MSSVGSGIVECASRYCAARRVNLTKPNLRIKAICLLLRKNFSHFSLSWTDGLGLGSFEQRGRLLVGDFSDRRRLGHGNGIPADIV